MLKAGPIGATLPVQVTQSERRGTFAYRLPLPMPAHGAYRVSLYFLGDQSRAQPMEVHINHVARLSRFDSAAEAGSDGLVLKEFHDVLPSSGGEVLIEFAPSPGSLPDACRVCAIQVLSA